MDSLEKLLTISGFEPSLNKDNAQTSIGGPLEGPLVDDQVFSFKQ